MQFTPIKSKFKMNKVPELYSPEQIFAIDNERVLITIAGKLIEIDRTKNTEFIHVGADQNYNYCYLHDNKVFINPSNQNYVGPTVSAIYDLKEERLHRLVYEPIVEARRHNNKYGQYVLMPDYSGKKDFSIVINDERGSPLEFNGNYEEINGWAKEKWFAGRTKFISPIYLWRNAIENKVYAMSFDSKNTSKFQIQELASGKKFSPNYDATISSPFAIFHNKIVCSHRASGVYSHHNMLDGKLGIISYSKQVNSFKMSPNGEYLAFSSFKRLVFLNSNLEEHKIIQIPEDVIDFTYSPDGLTINVLTKDTVITLDVD
jgi:hypothetical protein